jgi:hypothetical protein
MTILKVLVEVKKAKAINTKKGKSNKIRLNEKKPLRQPNINNNKKTSPKEESFIFINVITALIGEFFCFLAIAQAYLTRKPAFDLLVSSPFDTEIKLVGYFCFLLLSAGFLALFIALNLTQLTKSQQKRFSYIAASIGTFFIVLSSGLLVASQKIEQQWWGYFAVLTWSAGYVAMIFSDLTESQKFLYYFLKIVSLVLMLTGIVLAILG